MTITYHAGRRIQGLSSDTKPTDVQSGSRFEETDTQKIYYFDAGYTVHTFTSVGSDTFEVTSGSGDVEYLVVAGGGGGGNTSGGGGGGGGAGGFRTNVPGSTSGGGASAEPSKSVSTGSYTVTVGAAGDHDGSPTSDKGNPGGNSVFDNITSIGGGGGGGYGTNYSPTSGGSGGGGADWNNAGYQGGATNGASGTANQGFAGGNNVAYTYKGAGGGGAGSVGADASGNGDGGSGVVSTISGSSVTYARGGHGYNNVSGGYNSQPISNSGNGGGGSKAGGGTGVGGYSTGGSGIVIIRYKNSTGIVATGGTKTVIGQAFNEEA